MGTVRKLTGADAAQRAGEAGAGAARYQFDQARSTLMPYIAFGNNALPTLTDLQSNPEALQNSSAYKFRLDQGMNAITRKAAAAGFRGSGNVLYELQNFGQGLASEEYQNEFNRRYSLAQLGQSSAAALAGASVQAGNTMANSLTQGGLGAAQAQSGLFGGLAQGAGMGLGYLFATSDLRVKDNISLLYKDSRGFNWYEFTYKGNNTKHVGVIAQEVEQILPEAVVEFNGIKHVNYGML